MTRVCRCTSLLRSGEGEGCRQDRKKDGGGEHIFILFFIFNFLVGGYWKERFNNEIIFVIDWKIKKMIGGGGFDK